MDHLYEHAEDVLDAIAATTFASTLRCDDSDVRLAHLEARRKHLYVAHLNVNHAMNHQAQAERHQRCYDALR
jgi:hypothetical protein